MVEGRPMPTSTAGTLPGAACGAAPGAVVPPYGWVVDSVNVRVLLYVPVRSASLASTCCWNCRLTGSLETGPWYASRAVGFADPPTGANAKPSPAGLLAFACSADGSENPPLTRCPVAVAL